MLTRPLSIPHFHSLCNNMSYNIVNRVEQSGDVYISAQGEWFPLVRILPSMFFYLALFFFWPPGNFRLILYTLLFFLLADSLFRFLFIPLAVLFHLNNLLTLLRMSEFLFTSSGLPASDCCSIALPLCHSQLEAWLFVTLYRKSMRAVLLLSVSINVLIKLEFFKDTRERDGIAHT